MSEAKLIGVSGLMAGKEIVIGTDPLVIGRSPDASVSLPGDLSLSRNHAQIYPQGGLVFVTDLGSSNGTRVNGQVIASPTRLMEGDLITLGDQSFKFQVTVPPFPPSSPADFQKALQSVPDFATMYQMVQKDMSRNPRRYMWPTVIASILLFGFVYFVVTSAFGGLPFGGNPTQTQNLRESLKVGMTMDEVRDIAGEPESTVVDNGPVGHTEMWTYNQMSVFVHFGPDYRVMSIQTMK